MDAELKAKWIAALRSGDYKKGRVSLRSEENRYCCLGVLCEVMNVQVPIVKSGFPLLDAYGPLYDRVKSTVGEEAMAELWKLNDGVDHRREHSFPEIADYIEANL
jgi:hypothetical protein